jgi:acyl-CoA synthetase (AMP-forming)/AMP-acid ligase II
MAMATVNDRYSKEQIEAFYAEGLWCDYTMFDALEQQVAERPDKVFFTDSSTSYTFRELRDAALRLATGLDRRGVRPGDRVAIQIPNWTDFAVISMAISRIGAIIVPIMPIYRRDEVGYIVESAGVKAVFTAGEYRKFDHAAMYVDLARTSNSLETVIVVRSESVPEGAFAFADVPVAIEPEAAIAEIPPGVGPDDPFVIVFSSGTTSRPKGCLHTFNTMSCGARLLGKGWGYTADDVQFGPSPVTHTTGLVTSVILPLIHGAGSHIMEAWEPREGLERIAKFRCTAAVAATTFLQMILNVYDPDVHDASSMRFWTCAGSPIPGSFVKVAAAALPNMQVLSLYGRTENVTTTMCTIYDDPERSVTSDGKALPGQEVCIIDHEGNEVPRGEEGDIAYRGAMNSLEYINQPEETAAMYTADGFSRSGDLGIMDADGYVRVTGRLKDIVIRGGLNISVRQVEDLLTAHPAVGDVAVVGMPDERMGEKVCCYLVPAAGAEALTLEQIKDYLLGEGLAIQKVPERLEVVDALPTTATGKIQKHLLRADIAQKVKA